MRFLKAPPITIRHYFDFGADRGLVGDDLVRPDAWDALRTQTTGAFAIAETRDELERVADERPEIGERVRAIDNVLGDRSVASYGVGGAVVEAWLLRVRPRRLIVTDYGPETVARLRVLLPEADVVQHDLLAQGPLPAEVHLFHRIDTELTDDEWRGVFRRFATVPIVLVATEVIDLRRVLAELRARPMRRGATKAGWIRTRAAFERLWRDTHRGTPERFHDLDGWMLDPRG
jgi:hypothetical protein